MLSSSMKLGPVLQVNDCATACAACPIIVNFILLDILLTVLGTGVPEVCLRAQSLCPASWRQSLRLQTLLGASPPESLSD